MIIKKSAIAFAIAATVGATGASAQQMTAEQKCQSKGWTVGPSETPLDIVIPYTDLKIEDKKNAQLFDGGVCSILLEAPVSPLKNKNDVPGDEPSLNGYVVVEIPLADVDHEALHSLADKHLLEFGMAQFWRNAAKAASDKDALEDAAQKIGGKLPGQMKDFARHIELYTHSGPYTGIHARVSGVSFTVVEAPPEVVSGARAKVEADKAAKEAQKAAEKAEKERRKKEKSDDPGDSSSPIDMTPPGGGAEDPGGFFPSRSPALAP